MEADTTTAHVLRELEERLLQSEIRESPAAVGSLLADDFVEFGSSGRVFDKQQIVDALAGETTPRQRRLLDFRTSLLAPEVVLVTYRVTWADGDGEAPGHVLRSSVWKKIGGRWQLVFHQGTASPAP